MSEVAFILVKSEGLASARTRRNDDVRDMANGYLHNHDRARYGARVELGLQRGR